MQTFKILVSIAYILLLPLTVSGQDQLKLGHVNINEIVMQLPVTDSINLVLDKETKALEKDFENLQVMYNKAVDEYQRESPGYTDLMQQTKEDEIIGMQERIQNFRQNASTTLQARNRELFSPVYRDVQQAINKISLEQGYTYILDTGNGTVVFTSEQSNDIQPEVLALLGVK